MNLKYRLFNNEFPPKPIHLELEGWAGSPSEFKKEQKIQPYLCKPFVAANTYGYEIFYPYNTEVTVKKVNGKIEIEAENWDNDRLVVEKIGKPVGYLGDNHFSINTCLDVMVESDYALRIENHPRFYFENNVPCVIAGHLETNWWSSLFFVVFKAPEEGQVYKFKKGDKICQVFPVKNEPKFEMQEMTQNEANERRMNASILFSNRKLISTQYKDKDGNTFDNLYKKISRYTKIYGFENFKKLLNKLINKVEKFKKLKLKLFK